MCLVTLGTCLVFMKNQTPPPTPTTLKKKNPLPKVIRVGFQDPKTVQEVAPTLLNFLKPSIEKTITLSIQKSMAKCVPDAIEGALRKLKTEVMDPQINQKMKKLKPLKQR